MRQRHGPKFLPPPSGGSGPRIAKIRCFSVVQAGGRAIEQLRLALAIVLTLAPILAAAQESGREAVGERIEEIVRENFYDAQRAESFALPDASHGDAESFHAIVAEALVGLGASHTGRYEPDEIDYHELLDIFRFAVRKDLRRLFPPDGEVSYPGIGLIAKEVGGSLFVTDVYHAGTAARAGVREGDELLAVDGEPYGEIASFEGKAGKDVTLRLRRESEAEPVDLSVEVEAIRPNEMFTASISKSIRTFEHEGAKIGYIRLWSFTSAETRELVNEEIGTGRLSAADGLILDLRSRWGGAPLDAAEIFLGGTPPTEFRDREGNRFAGNVRWRKPVVAIIDEGTRSGLEAFAYALKTNGIPLVGARTARAVLAGTAFMLPDDSLLLLAVRDVVTDGRRLEETGVEPDIPVERDIRYENGDDPQFDAALRALAERL
ncbi:PDZ domain-containing protein [Aquamicrobium sp. LC103]|nr:PDZ domain-containing protein [Aquamicrobium sp. LC103]